MAGRVAGRPRRRSPPAPDRGPGPGHRSRSPTTSTSTPLRAARPEHRADLPPDAEPLTRTGVTCPSATTGGPAPCRSGAGRPPGRAARPVTSARPGGFRPGGRARRFVLGGPRWCGPVPVDDAAEHVFGVVLLSDWSARDIRASRPARSARTWGKSFATPRSRPG
ncbi:hypothetical protein HBB16_17775 [Pseudonocardia sp. MCCB 268]|nr:hypothetical protein [Pseudonocardia cytotoxica]